MDQVRKFNTSSSFEADTLENGFWNVLVLLSSHKSTLLISFRRIITFGKETYRKDFEFTNTRYLLSDYLFKPAISRIVGAKSKVITEIACWSIGWTLGPLINKGTLISVS